MTKDKDYAGIDLFRFVAAILVITIHTSPLADFEAIGDFILTRIIARIAVPFFFMTSGFFLISRYVFDERKLWGFVKKTALIYAVAIVFYIPVNLYSGYFMVDNLLLNIIKDLVFDGTFYHLWYLPASMIGAVIAWFLVKKIGFVKALAVTALLYVTGLFGDSYYGLIENNSAINGFYGMFFQISDYTRNGFFFAPVFFVLGGLIADRQKRLSYRKSVCGLCISFALMFCEAMLLFAFKLQKHDSMYVFLVPCMYFLFVSLSEFKGKRMVTLRTMSLLIYIIHPMIIIAIRLFAKVFHLQTVFVDNSMIHFLSVGVVSVMFAFFLVKLWDRMNFFKKKQEESVERAGLEINFAHLEHNVNTLQKAMQPGCELMAVVKAEAYGHGMFQIATYVNKMGVQAFAVATIEEGIMLRKYGISGEILVLGYTTPARAWELRKYKLTQTLIDYDYAVLLNQQGCDVKAHIKVDTGMHRLGFDKEDIEGIAAVFCMKHIIVDGIFTHLCASDSLEEKEIDYTKKQIMDFYNLIELLKERKMNVPKIHIQSSYGLLNYPELKCDYVRAGIVLYGVFSSPNEKHKLELDLKPVLSLKSKVILLRKVKMGETVGYSRAFTAERDSLIGVVPVGYADGYPRNLSEGKGYVLIHGHKAPIVGKICMDQLTVDVTDIPEASVGMKVTLIGRDGNEEISAVMVAEKTESITNELLSRMGQRVKGYRKM